MKKIKPLLSIVSILVIGFVLGFLVSGQITKNKMDKFLRWGTEDGFEEIVYETISPDTEQRTKLEPIIKKYAKLNGELHDRWKKEHGDLMRGLSEELSKILRPEQMEDWQIHNRSEK